MINTTLKLARNALTNVLIDHWGWRFQEAFFSGFAILNSHSGGIDIGPTTILTGMEGFI